METAAQAKARRGPKAKILRQLTRIHTPATATGAGFSYVTWIGSLLVIVTKLCSFCIPGQPIVDLQIGQESDWKLMCMQCCGQASVHGVVYCS